MRSRLDERTESRAERLELRAIHTKLAVKTIGGDEIF